MNDTLRLAMNGAFTGFLIAAWIDYKAFRSWKSFDEAKKYAWRIAVWRWFQGAVVGAVAALGFFQALNVAT